MTTQQQFREANAHYRITPSATIANVLATGPTIAGYTPNPATTTYGVNDIFAHHPTHHLVTLDNPFEAHAFGPSTATPQRIETTQNSTPTFWHYWKETNLYGLAHKPGLTIAPLVPYFGKGLFAHCCPKWYCSAFVATALAARHGHTTIITYGIDWYGHPVQEAMIASQLKGFGLLAAEMKTHGITLYASSPQSALAQILPVYKPQKITP